MWVEIFPAIDIIYSNNQKWTSKLSAIAALWPTASLKLATCLSSWSRCW